MADATPHVLLYDMPYSHHCVKARKLLRHKGVAFETREVGYHDKRELLEATGQDYVPYLMWDGEGIPWADIVDAVEARVPEPSAFPPGMRGQARMVEQWAHDVLEERVWRVVVSEFADTFSNDHERWVFEEVQELKRGPLEEMAARQPRYLADLRAHLAHLETALEGRDYLFGDAPTVADFACFGAIHPLYHVGRALPDDLPRTRAWHGRVGKI